MPAARLPEPKEREADPEQLLLQLPDLLDRQQQVNEADRLVAQYLSSGGSPQRLMARNCLSLLNDMVKL